MTSREYALAVDVGTSRTAAAIARTEKNEAITASAVPLGRRGDNVATVAFVTDDGDLLFADTAERRGLAQPGRLIREYKRAIGDDVPISVGGRSLRPEDLFGRGVAEIVAEVTRREGAPPSAIALTHPTAWGPHRLALIADSLDRVGIHGVQFIPEPEAAARHHGATHPLAAGQALAVYDLGGGTFDAVVLRTLADGFEVLGSPAGLDDVGGADFDDAVFRHVLQSAGVDASTLTGDDADTRLALARLRRECVDAKEALSFDSDVTIPVLLPTGSSTVRLTRGEFESMIGPAVDRTLDALDGALDAAALEAGDLQAILLIGGSSRIPLVAQRLSERFDSALAVNADPKAAVALGAARTALATAGAPAAVVPSASSARIFDNALVGGGELVLARPASDHSAPRRKPEHAVKRRVPVLTAAAVVVLAGTLALGGTMAAASLLGNVAREDVPTPSPVQTSTGSTDLPRPEPVAAAGVQEAVVDTASKSEANDQSAPQDGPKKGAKGAAPSPKATPSPKSTPSKAPKSSATPAPGGQNANAGSGQGPAAASNPPANQTPAGETVDPTPTDPPVTPTDPPVTPTDPPVTPTDPPVTPTDPPVTPTDPPADPAPTEPPAAGGN